ncbi:MULTISPECIES: FecR domain-containing protein [unclassified Fibrobacter]|uniref:FecR family protein n=1 Tax=unclassified Fibrobacter TaxID=2634177 RepID=UPI000D7B510C|nr:MULTISPECIES: FecR family protein [unclassified Fibrobacter]PWJ71836.1 FecR family protein [Fibrobacter sp. UWR4]PZW73751.1 FecR family protein [Fibrobacter sp. UWR1]
MFEKCSLLHGLAILALVPAMAYSAPAAGKVRSVLGTVERQKISQTDWNALRANSNVFQSDKVRTGEASEVIFNLPDGSSITIAEFAEVELATLLQPNDKGGFETRIDIKKGHINFAVEKLKQKNSTFKFKTGTATASIRGTEGYVGGEGVFFAGLKTGKLEIVPEGKDTPVSIVAGETTFGKDSLVVLKLASSGHPRFAKKLEKLLADPSKDLNALVVEVQKADSSFQQQLKDEADSSAVNALPSNGFTIKTSSPAEVCAQGLEVEGYYRTADSNATMTIKVGSVSSGNLITAADGQAHAFNHKVSISDENGLWTANKATVTFSGAGVNDSKTLNLNVNRACGDVNRKAPVVSISSYDSLRCAANISVGNMQNDAGIFAVEVDGAPMSEDAITRNVQQRIKLKSGSHEYLMRAEDQAGNKTEVSRVMGCYPMKRFNVDVDGPTKELVTAPPLGSPDSPARLVKTLQFRVKIPENNPEFLYKVLVKQNGKIILQETLSQIQNLDYQLPVELSRELPNRIEIEVTHKSGFRAKAKKVYEVSPR